MSPLAVRTTRSARITRVVLSALLGALAVSAAQGGVAVADDADASWAVRTASNDLGAERTSFTYAVDPGGHLDDSLVVVNHGTAPLELAVYAADGYTTDSGQFDLLTRDGESAGTGSGTGIGAWVRAAGDTVTVQPGASADVPFTVSIPSDAQPGDYAGGIVTSLVQQGSAQGIDVDRRLGIRVNLRVGGEVSPGLAVENLRVGYAGTLSPFGTGDATVTYTVHNTGNTIASAQQAVSVSGPFGMLRVDAGASPALPQLLPGERRTVSIAVRGVAPTLRLAATVTLVPLVTDASGSTSSLSPVRGTAHGWAIPWTLLALVLALVAAGAWAVLRVRRNRRRRALREEARVRDAVEEALRDRAAADSGVDVVRG